MGWWNRLLRRRGRSSIPLPPHLPSPGGWSSFPSWQQKQQLLYGGKGSREERLRIAGELLEHGRETEAMDYLELEADPDLLKTVLQRAENHGDAFLFRRAAATLGIRPTPEDWERVARRAESLGKESFARMARTAAQKLDAAPGSPDRKEVGGD